ncbi:MAG: hypothetical protein AAF196_08990 [Planctomycetota bacterium]
MWQALSRDLAALAATDAGETALYYPGGDLAHPTELSVDIERIPVLFEGESSMPIHEIRMCIPKDGKITLIERGLDRVRVPIHPGERPALMRVAGISESHRSHWEVTLVA